MQKRHKQPKLFEGLRSGDLKNMVNHRFTVDQYKSKMGLDDDIIVVSFRVKDKFPATDLVEFIEKGYPAVLDADMSTGEEKDGDYAVFVELKRDKKVAKELEAILRGMTQLCDCTDWRFRYFKDVESHDFTVEAFEQFVPLTKDDYLERIKHQKVSDVKDVLDQGPATVADIDESNNLTFRKVYSGDLTVQLEAIGDYEELKESLQGGIQLDEASRGQTLYLEKYLGNYDINKINNKFLIRNKGKAVIISKGDW
jgi:hypothetical protein